jgi:hypothetical protein
MKLVALCGLHGAGKDTVADALPARKLAFADVLYREVAEAFGVTVAELKCRETKEVASERLKTLSCKNRQFGFYVQGVAHGSPALPRSPRQILQWWGDFRRAQDPDYFTGRTREAVEFAGYQGQPVVITDCRFPNEAAMVRQLGGQIWQVVRPGHNPPCNGHASENDGTDFKPDVVIVNDGSLDDLKEKALKEFSK